MNASRYRRDGRKSFCPECTPEEHLKRVGRNLYGYPLRCFKHGWGKALQSYEKSLIPKEKVMSTYQHDVYKQLPEELQDKLQDEGYCPEGVFEYAEIHINALGAEIDEAKTKLRVMHKAHGILEKQNARMMKVLTRFGNIITSVSNLEAELDFEGNQGSERREFDHGCYCGRTVFANELYKILMEEE